MRFSLRFYVFHNANVCLSEEIVQGGICNFRTMEKQIAKSRVN